MKNLSQQRTRQRRAAGATKLSREEIKGKIVEFTWWLKKLGYAKSTVEQRTLILKGLAKRGVNLLNPEQVKLLLARHDNWSSNYKQSIISCYERFVDMEGLGWKSPRCKPTEKLPFIPHEKEIDALISGCGEKVATSLQLLKETAMRIGEAWKLEWIDVDVEKNIVKCEPAKGSRPRVLKVSSKLIAMLEALPKRNRLVFGGTTMKSHRANYFRQRRRLAKKLHNPRLGKITFHTFRHWKATMEYHKTKDILHVKQLLGHRMIENTMKYTQLAKFEDPEELTCRVAASLEEAKELIEAGFQ